MRTNNIKKKKKYKQNMNKVVELGGRGSFINGATPPGVGNLLFGQYIKCYMDIQDLSGQ